MLGKSLRAALAIIALGIVVWSFFDVTRRAVIRWQTDRATPVTLTILHWGSAEEEAIVERLVQDYERAHPHVRIRRINAPQFDSKLKTMMAAGNPPDLFYLPPRLLPELASLGLIRPIDDFVEQERQAGRGAIFDDFFPVLLEAFRYDVETERTGTGQLFGLPKDFSTAVFYANLDLLEKAGVTLPGPDGWTWDEFAEAARRVTALNGTPGFEGRRLFGANFNIWPDTLRNFIWTFGGDFFGPGGFTDVALDSPESQAALEMIRRMRLDEQTVFNATGVDRDGGQEFFTGNIALNGPIGRWQVPRYRTIRDFRWDVLPVPHARGQPPASQLFMTAWTMSSATRHPDEAFQLMLFLTGPEGGRLQSELGLAIPPLRSVAESDAFLNPPGIPPHNARLFLDAIEHARVQQIPRQAEWERIVGGRINESIQLGKESTLESARVIEREWLEELASPLRRERWEPFNWTLVVGVALAGLAILTGLLLWKALRERLGAIDRATERAGFAFIAPWLIGFVALTAGPMLVSLLLSFSQWTAMTPMTDARWVGLANFEQMFTVDPRFWFSLQVTVVFVLLAVPVTQVAALAVALLMNSRVRGIATFRTIFFVPSVISGVALAVLWLQIFNNEFGVLNQMLRTLFVWALPLGLVLLAAGAAWLVWEPTRKFVRADERRVNLMTAGTITACGLVLSVLSLVMTLTGARGVSAPDWFGVDAGAFAIPAFVIMGLWGVGGGMIIYLAGLKGIPASLYEAAMIDGAGPMRRLWSVTLPMLSPLIFYNLVMGIIGSFQVFTQAMVMTGGGPNDRTLFYVLYLYRQAFEFHNMGYASAMAWVLFFICLVLTVALFAGSKRLVYYEGLRQ